MGRFFTTEFIPFAAPTISGAGSDCRSDRWKANAGHGGPSGRWPVGASRNTLSKWQWTAPSEFELLAEYRKNLLIALGAASVLCVVESATDIARRGLRSDSSRHRHGPADRADQPRRADRPERPAFRIARSWPTPSTGCSTDSKGRFTRLAQFSADIAHELRTPVNNLRGEVEVALGKPRSPDEYREVLTSNLEEYGRLARLIESLLFLARAENPQTQIAKESVDVGAELATVCEFYEAAAGEKGVESEGRRDGSGPRRLEPHIVPASGRQLGRECPGPNPEGRRRHPDRHGPTRFDHRGSRRYRLRHFRRSLAACLRPLLPGRPIPIIVERECRPRPRHRQKHRGTARRVVEIACEAGKGTRVTMTFPSDMTKL